MRLQIFYYPVEPCERRWPKVSLLVLLVSAQEIGCRDVGLGLDAEDSSFFLACLDCGKHGEGLRPGMGSDLLLHALSRRVDVGNPPATTVLALKCSVTLPRFSSRHA